LTTVGHRNARYFGAIAREWLRLCWQNAVCIEFHGCWRERTLGAVPLIVPVLGKHLDVNALLELLDGLAALVRYFQTP